MIARALSLLGLTTWSEAEAEYGRLNDALFDAVTERNDWEAKFKLAATDLAKQDGIIESMAWEIRGHEETIASLRHDANMWRNYLKRSRDRKAGKKGVANG